MRDTGTTEVIKVTPYVKDLLKQIQENMTKEFGVKIGLNAALRAVLQKELK